MCKRSEFRINKNWFKFKYKFWSGLILDKLVTFFKFFKLFINKLDELILNKGNCLLLIENQNGLNYIIPLIKNKGFNVDIVNNSKDGYEKLFILKIYY